MKIRRYILLFVAAASFAQGTALANGISINGFVQGNFSARVTGEALPNSDGGDFLLGEERLQLELAGHNKAGNAGFLSKTDFFHDAITNTANIDLREAYGELTSRYFDFRVGRQMVTWGIGDLLFINDVFPKDWSAFFSGQPTEYLKIGSDALKFDFYPKFISIGLIVTPLFREDNLPSNNRFFLWDPFPAVSDRQTVNPDKNFKNVEVALRLYRDIGGFETSLYFSKGFWRTPSLLLDNTTTPTQISFVFPRLLTYGFSVERSVLGGVFGLESGYYDSMEDRAGTNYSIPNSQWRYLAGYKRPLWREATLGLQYYGEYMFRQGPYRTNLPAGFSVQDRLRHIMTTRLTQMLWHQTLRLSLFAFFSPSDVDYQIIPEVQYHFTDEFSATVGANVFGGKDSDTFFGQLDKNDNVYCALRYTF
ncbi:MAG: hypothetical protein A3I75_03490 [Deltaproteobacteria bacterium RIFCSPLOWO2_02_FULL_50_16]|nr:MAG: hypothetical protein A3B79_04455 [Deltaproteobacteria bacterium RIFCSPHIGHO2_02_FULL_50_15]OGQ55609.1 MAG: hypothetical protein A3I75_03490 [Deltaproteobacteria bacterium RIFCSPLOWO2_02_FULL_50_16]OGQ68375.1 MAG: hypothetical protein A3F89_07525 [Deltaproteobacteria bacterium RIFCSPLOWO2_12_FULL_50_11]